MGNLVPDNEKEWILEAINHLKHRKARPDLSRISLRMKRKYQINFAQTKKLLDSLIESGIVVKAVYKNNTSYRDVSKWKKGKLGGHIQNSNKMLKRFVRAIEAKEIEKGTGVTCEEIEEFLGTQVEEKCFLSGAALREALEKEVTTGYLKKVNNGAATRYQINEENESLLMVLDETETRIHDCKSNHTLTLGAFDHDTQTTSKAASDIKEANLDPTLLKDKILTVLREVQHFNQLGLSLQQIKQYLVDKHSLVRDDSYLEELLEQFVQRNLLNKNGECYIIPNKVPVSVAAESLPSNKIITPFNYQETVSHLDGSDLDLDRVPRDAQQVTILQGLSLIPKSATAKETATKPSTLKILPDLSHTISEDYKNVSSFGPSRPPSKRRRIMKDHGPDFEIEMPTKTKGKWQDTRDSVYPTPSNSPNSERSDCTLAQSLKNPMPKKKRGRPKKQKEDATSRKDEISFEDDLSQQATPSESSHTFQASNDMDEDSLSSTPVFQDICGWTSQQVADYFKEKGYIEEAQSMLDHDIDGSALGLLRRSDIVGPPLGGILHVKKLGTALKLFRDIRDLLYQGHSSNYVDPYEEKPFCRS